MTINIDNTLLKMLKYFHKGSDKMKLSEGICGEGYIIVNMQLESAVMRRLYALGMTQGTRVCILNQKKGGPMIIKVRGTRFALGKGFCEGIFVEGANNERA